MDVETMKYMAVALLILIGIWVWMQDTKPDGKP